MFESFIIMVREGIEASLVISILLTVLRQTGRRHLERAVFWGLGTAVVASIGAALALSHFAVSDELYEGSLYWVSAVFVITMMMWMHRTARSLKKTITERVQQTGEAGSGNSSREAWGLGAFAFLMVFREGAETVMFLSAVNLTTDALLGFLGTVLGLGVAIIFAVMFVRGSIQVNLHRFFTITEWVLGIFVAQLVVNGYHEFSEAGLLPATQKSMAFLGPIVRNNSLFVLALVAIPLFIWLTGKKRATTPSEGLTEAERRLEFAKARRDLFYRYGAVASTLLVLGAVSIVFAREVMPKQLPPPDRVGSVGGIVSLPLTQLQDGNLHRYGLALEDRTVRFLAMKTSDGKIHTTLDACHICGPFGYIQEGRNLVCLNCSAEINPLSLGEEGGCNPIPLTSEITDAFLNIRVSALKEAAGLFTVTGVAAETAIDPVCGMRVTLQQAKAFATVGGKTYYFCSEKCRGQFQK